MHIQLPDAEKSVAPLGFCLALALTFLGSSGCGRSDFVHVQGRVSYSDGSPLPLGRVLIDAGGKPTGAWGRIQPDGRFTIGRRADNDGIGAGTYRVAIVDALIPPGEDGPAKRFVDDRFTDFATSGLEFKVPEQTDWQIVVEPPATRGRK